MVIAIDGPAGAGKSTVARAVAERLAFTFLDTGAMYRAVALASLRSGSEPAQLAAEIGLDLGERVLLDGEDVTSAIREPQVTAEASRVAAIPEVRTALVARQRAIVATGDWVAEGRDVGSVVAPDAAVKVFLHAHPDERARRRATQLGRDVESVKANQAERDQRDSSAQRSTLAPAPGAVSIDTTDLALDAVVERICSLVSEVRA
jgi:CMP/dCMP kinase